MLVLRHSSKKCRKGFANHFVLLLQFHESRNAAERKRGFGREEGGQKDRERERETVSGISRSW